MTKLHTRPLKLPPNNNAWLKRFMKERKLTRAEVAKACYVNVSTVDRWLVPPRKTSRRQMPTTAVALLLCLDTLELLPEKNT